MGLEAPAAKEAIIKRVKEHRKDLDCVLQYMKETAEDDIGGGKGRREISLAITNLQQSIMWLGMTLKEVAPEVNPYPNSYDPSNTIVDPTADGLKL